MTSPRSTPAIAQSGFTVVSPNKKWFLVWEDIGEGVSGDFDPDNAEDRPMFRAYLSDADGADVESGSYCTLAVVGEATEEGLRDVSLDLFNMLGDDFSRKVMEMWTWQTKNAQ